MAIVSARRDITRNLAGYELSQVRLQGLGWPDFLDDAVGYVKDKAVDAGSFVVDTAKKGGELAWGGATGIASGGWNIGKKVVGKTVGFVKEHPALLLATPLAPWYVTTKAMGVVAGGGGPPPPPPGASPATVDAANDVAQMLEAQVRRRAQASATQTMQQQNQGYATTAAQGDSGLTNQSTALYADPAAAAAAAAEQMASEGPTGFAAWPTWQKVALFGGGIAVLGFVGWKLTHRRGGGRTKS
jgi:hypothetical protein